MFAVRYVAVAALALLLGTFAPLRLPSILTPAHADRLAAICGAVIVVSLFLMKFVGPPPRAFALRAALAFVLAAVAAYASVMAPASPPLTAIIVGLGLVLLGWYARE